MRVLLHDPPPCDACIHEGIAGCQESSALHTLRLCGQHTNLCARHWRELQNVVNSVMCPDSSTAKVKEMPWADELAAEKERSKWWK